MAHRANANNLDTGESVALDLVDTNTVSGRINNRFHLLDQLTLLASIEFAFKHTLLYMGSIAMEQF